MLRELQQWCGFHKALSDMWRVAIPWYQLRVLAHGFMSCEELGNQNFFSTTVSIICALLLVCFALLLAIPGTLLVGISCVVYAMRVSCAVRIRTSHQPDLSLSCWELLEAAEDEAQAAVQDAVRSVRLLCPIQVPLDPTSLPAGEWRSVGGCKLCRHRQLVSFTRGGPPCGAAFLPIGSFFGH